jgi:hypothetical protein
MTNFLDLPAEEFAEKFLQILSNPKNSSVKEYLTDGWNSDIIGYKNERE